MGRRAETEPLDVWPRWPLAYALCAALSALGSVLSVSLPVPGAALALAGALLFILDAGFLIPLARRPLGRRASRTSSPGTRATGRAGSCWWPTTTPAAVGSLSGAGCAGSSARSRCSGPSWRCSPAARYGWRARSGIALSVVQFVPTVALIVAVALLLDIALSPTRAGENDNASGVALALRLAERFSTEELEHFEVDVLFSGSQKAMAAGTRGFIARHARRAGRGEHAVHQSRRDRLGHRCATRARRARCSLARPGFA